MHGALRAHASMMLKRFATQATAGTVSLKLTPTDRFARATLDVAEAMREREEPAGWVASHWQRFQKWFYNSLDHVVDLYTSLQYWLNDNCPRGYIVAYVIISFASAALYVLDMVTDVLVAQTLLNEDYNVEAGVVLVWALNHYAVIALMLFNKFWYAFEEQVLIPINSILFPWSHTEEVDSAYEPHGMDVVWAALFKLTGLGIFSADENGPSILTLLVADVLDALGRLLIKILATLATSILILLAVPFLDLMMLCVEVLEKIPWVQNNEFSTLFLNFLQQYQTLRIPSQCFLQSVPQTIYQTSLYLRFRSSTSGTFGTQSIIITSIVTSGVNILKNFVDIFLGYKVSGFTLLSYLKNMVEFEGAANLPFRWNALRSSLAERLVLVGDFTDLAHAQKMRLFQAALQRHRIVISNCPENNVRDECVIGASSWTLLGFISNMLPVSLSGGHDIQDAVVVLDLEKIGRLPWRDDTRWVNKRTAEKLVNSVRVDMGEFMNAGGMWRNLAVVRLVDCGLAGEQVDAVAELLVRSRCQVLDLTGNALGDVGMALLCDGMLINSSLEQLQLVRTQMSDVGCFHLMQGMSEHTALAVLGVGSNPLRDEGARHLASLMATLPALTTLSAPHIQATHVGISLLCETVPRCPSLTSLDLGRTPCMAHSQSLAALLALVSRNQLCSLNLNGCVAGPAEMGCVLAALQASTSLHSLNISRTYLSPYALNLLCEALEARCHVYLAEVRKRTLTPPSEGLYPGNASGPSCDPGSGGSDNGSFLCVPAALPIPVSRSRLNKSSEQTVALVPGSVNEGNRGGQGEGAEGLGRSSTREIESQVPAAGLERSSLLSSAHRHMMTIQSENGAHYDLHSQAAPPGALWGKAQLLLGESGSLGSRVRNNSKQSSRARRLSDCRPDWAIGTGGAAAIHPASALKHPASRNGLTSDSSWFGRKLGGANKVAPLQMDDSAMVSQGHGPGSSLPHGHSKAGAQGGSVGGGGAQHGPRSGTTSLPGVSSGGQTTASGSKFTLKGLATAFARFRKMSQALSKMPTDKPMTRVDPNHINGGYIEAELAPEQFFHKKSDATHLTNMAHQSSYGAQPDIMSIIHEVPHLEALNIAHCGVPGSELKQLLVAIEPVPGLCALDLSGNPQIGLEGMLALGHVLRAQKATLLRLRLHSCGISPCALPKQVASALALLVELDLGCNPVGDEGVVRLSMFLLQLPTHPTLQVLRLGAVNMGMVGFNSLLDGLLLNSHLQHLSVDNNLIGGVDMVRWEKVQLSNKALQFLDLRSNQLNREWCAELQSLAVPGSRCIIRL